MGAHGAFCGMADYKYQRYNADSKNIDKSESSGKWGHMGHSVAWQIRNIKDIMLTVKIYIKVSQVENGGTWGILWHGRLEISKI